MLESKRAERYRMWIGCGFCFVEKSVRRDGDWAFVFGVLGFETARSEEGWWGSEE